jgi:hypothetical protein
MNHRSVIALAVILVLSGVAAFAGGRRLGDVVRPDRPATLDVAAVQPAADMPPHLEQPSARAVAE